MATAASPVVQPDHNQSRHIYRAARRTAERARRKRVKAWASPTLNNSHKMVDANQPRLVDFLAVRAPPTSPALHRLALARAHFLADEKLL